MHRSTDMLGKAILELASFINDPRQDWRMMAEAGLDLDPAFLPLLVRLGMGGPAGVVELAGQLGRDHSTVSRQIDRLEAAGLVERSESQSDRRVRIASVTPDGQTAVAALSAARGRLLDKVLAGWTSADQQTLSRLLSRFTGDLTAAVRAAP